MKKKATVIVFPGSNCDKEAFEVLERSGFDVSYTWHDESLPADLKLCFIPGGFSYGDYLRSGAIAAKAKVMDEVREFAKNGGFVIGVCNGFQVLTEARILPGALVRNAISHFVCKKIKVDTINKTSVFTRGLPASGKVGVAHADGMFVADAQTLEMLKKEDRIAFKYQDNFNGSADSIAGIIGGENYNILGLMPHPERTLVSADFQAIFTNLEANI